MKDELISVIIPVYNTEKYLHKCLKSVINQTYKNLEIIVINDGSTDKSKEIIFQEKNEDSRIKLINIENHGVSFARNIGIKQSTGKYIIFIDSDDFIDNEMIEKLYKSIKKYNSDLSMCCIKKVNDKGNIIFESKKIDSEVLSSQQFMYNIFDFDYAYGYPYNKLFVKSKIKNIYFDENVHFMEDFMFVCDTIDNVNTISIENSVYYYYFQNENGAIHSGFNEKWLTRIDAEKRIIDKYINKFSKKSKELFLFDYVMMIYSNYYYYYKNKRLNKNIKYKFKNESKKYYKQLLRSKYLSAYEKAKILLKCNFPIIYGKIMSFK